MQYAVLIFSNSVRLLRMIEQFISMQCELLPPRSAIDRWLIS